MNTRKSRIPKVAQEIMLTNPRFVISISHSDYLGALGGTELCILQEREFLSARGIDYIQLSPGRVHRLAKNQVERYGSSMHVNVGGESVGFFDHSVFLECIWKLKSKGHKLISVQLHHTLGWDLDRVEETIRVAAPPRLSIFIHDYYTVCVGFNLLRNDRIYCRAPSADSHACLICKHGNRRSEYLARVINFFNAMELLTSVKYVSPSAIAAQIWAESHPQRRPLIEIIPHKVLERTEARVERSIPKRKLRAAFLGYSSPVKGYLEWIEATNDPEVREAYELFHLGACGIPQKHVEVVDVSFLKGGPDAMTKALKQHEIDIAVLCSIWPETFSFTCFEAIAANSLVITISESGNIASTIRNNPELGIVLEPGTALKDALRHPQLFDSVDRRRRTASHIYSWNQQLAESLNLSGC